MKDEAPSEAVTDVLRTPPGLELDVAAALVAMP
jgi:hypothetical protein